MDSSLNKRNRNPRPEAPGCLASVRAWFQASRPVWPGRLKEGKGPASMWCPHRRPERAGGRSPRVDFSGILSATPVEGRVGKDGNPPGLVVTFLSSHAGVSSNAPG